MRQALATYVSRHRLLAYGIAFLAYFGLWVLFIELADEVDEQETVGFDVMVLQAIYTFTNPIIDVLMMHLTILGGVVFVSLVTAVLLGFYYFKKQYRSFIFTLMTMAGSAGLVVGLKQYFSRERPSLWEQIVVEQSYSFPSGHSVASSALALTLIILLWHTRYRIPALVTGVLYVLLIGFSRMYLGVHYPTDIVAGWMISALWVGIVLALVKAGSKYYGR